MISSEELFAAVEAMLEENRLAEFTVTGDSMWPLIRHGRDRVIVEKCGAEGLKKGDIVLMKPCPGRYLLHRITFLGTDFIETTGDGNCFRDGRFPKSAAVARVVTVLRKQKKISCNSPYWKFIFRCWMALFRVRRWLLSGIDRLLRLKSRLRGSHKQRE